MVGRSSSPKPEGLWLGMRVPMPPDFCRPWPTYLWVGYLGLGHTRPAQRWALESCLSGRNLLAASWKTKRGSTCDHQCLIWVCGCGRGGKPMSRKYVQGGRCTWSRPLWCRCWSLPSQARHQHHCSTSCFRSSPFSQFCLKTVTCHA